MLKIEKNKTYEFRLMPNFFNLKQNIMELKVTSDKSKTEPFVKVFCYVLTEDNKIECLLINKKIREYIHQCLVGFHGTSEGYYVSGDRVKHYYAYEDKSFISLDSYDKKTEKLSKFTDIEYYERINFWDVKSEYILTFKTRDNTGFFEIYNLGFKKVKPLYKNGDDQKSIISLYDNVEKMDHIIENYKKEISTNYPNDIWFFGDDATKYYHKQCDKKRISETINDLGIENVENYLRELKLNKIKNKIK